MKLTHQGIQNTADWHKAGILLPGYDPALVAKKTKENPTWVHFGAGNIFRGYLAVLQDDLLGRNLAETGIVAVETFDYDVIDKIYDPFDNLALVVTLKPDGTTASRVVGSLTEGVRADAANGAEFARLKQIFESSSLQMCTFTITEKGYALAGMDGAFFPLVQQDMASGPAAPRHAMSIATAMLYARYCAGGAPLAMVSVDNCSHNGEKLQTGVLTIAKAWQEKGFVPAGFIDYLQTEEKVSFPWSMIDKITPRPAEVVKDLLLQAGVEDMAPIITAKNTYIAPFVNAEGPQYLVIEDKFPAGRPPLEQAGVYFTSRDTVNRVERMKVTTCLNPLHTALAVYGCLFGYELIADEMKDDELRLLVETIGYKEGMPVVTDPGILSPRAFIAEVLEQRLPNVFMPDAPQRIATDTSQKVGIRFGETIKSYLASDALSVNELTAIPLALAGWLRYLLAVDDAGKPFECSPDPMLSELQAMLSDVVWNQPQSYTGQLRGLLANASVFGTDLVKAGLADKIEGMFQELLQGEGAVRATLKKHLG